MTELEPKKQSQQSKIADLFALQCRSNDLPQFIREHPFAVKVGRKWRFDFCWNLGAGINGVHRPIRLAVEIEGLVVRQLRIQDPHTRIITIETIMSGRHATISGFKEDCIKYSTAALLGWTVLRFEQSQVKKRFAIAMTMRVLHRMGWRKTNEHQTTSELESRV
jgi:hypothetical protein